MKVWVAIFVFQPEAGNRTQEGRGGPGKENKAKGGRNPPTERSKGEVSVPPGERPCCTRIPPDLGGGGRPGHIPPSP